MTGKEAWTVIAPILGKLVDAEGEQSDLFVQAYVTTFFALKDFDGNECDNCKYNKGCTVGKSYFEGKA